MLNDLLEFSAGLCCFGFFGISFVVIVITVASKVWGRKRKRCTECSALNEAATGFCGNCGAPFPGTGASKSFYIALLQRLANWRTWGWLHEGEYDRLVALQQRDLDVFEGREKVRGAGVADEPSASRMPPPLIPQQTGDVETGTPESEGQFTVLPTGGDVPGTGDVEPPSDTVPVTARVQSSTGRVVSAEPVDETVEVMRPPRKLSDILQAFLAESNIKIGEFISGLLIVVGSIGLVVTLNVQFKDDIPYLPAAVFMTVVILFHLAGLYSLHKWNLAASSKTVLYIGNLLIPLNMLAATMRDTLPDTQGWMFYLAVLVGVIGFGSMSFYSARALRPERWWPQMLVVIGPTGMQTVIKLLSAQGLIDGIVAVNVVVLVPLAMVAVGVLAEHRAIRKAAQVADEDAASLLRILTLGLFSLAGCVAILFLKTSHIDSMTALARQLANPFMMMSFIVVSAGMLLHRRMEDESQLRLRLLGTWMAIIGCLGVVGSFTLAVPDINSMLVVSVVGTILALIFSRVTRIPFLSTTGTVAAGLAAWCLLVKIRGTESAMLSGRDLADYWFDGVNALLLTCTAVVAGALHSFCLRSEARADREFARFGLMGVGVTATMGLAVAFVCATFRQADPSTDCTVIVFGLYAIAALVAAVYVPYRAVIVAAVVLVPVTWLQTVNCTSLASWDGREPLDKLGMAAYLTALTYVVALVGYWIGGQRSVGILRKSSKSTAETFLTGSSFIAYAIALVYTVGNVYAANGFYEESLWRSVGLCILITIVALIYVTDWTWMVVQVQVMLTIGMAVTLGWSLQHPDSGLGADSHLRAQLIALSIGMLCWAALRKYCQQSQELGRVIVTDMMYVDFVVQVFASGIMYLIWLSSLIGPLAASYGSESVLAGLSTFVGHDINYWDWVLWAVTLTAWASVIPDRHRRVSSICALVVFSALPILATDRFVQTLAAERVAFPHFLRWGYGTLGVVMALIICTDFLWWKRLINTFPRFMDNQDEKSSGTNVDTTWSILRVFAFLAAAVPVVYLTFLHYVHVTGIYLTGTGGQFDVMSGGVAFFERNPSLTFAAPLLLVMATAWIYGVRTRRPIYLLLGFPFWQCGWMFFGLMAGWLDSQPAQFADLIHGFNWFLIGLAIYAGLWGALNRMALRQGENESRVATHWKAELFKWCAEGRVLFACSLICLVVYTCIGVVDGFVLTGGLERASWKQRLHAFADFEALIAVVGLGAALVVWRYGQAGFQVSVVLGAALLGVNVIVGHFVGGPLGTATEINASVTEVVSTRISITEVLLSQTVGWSVIFLGIVAFVVNRLPHWHRNSGEVHIEQETGDSFSVTWQIVDRISAPWIGLINLLAVLLGAGLLVLFEAGAHNDWVLISLVVGLALMFIILSSTLQQALLSGWALVTSLVAIALVDLHFLDTNVYLADLSAQALGNHCGHLLRTELAALSMLAIVLAASVKWLTRILGIPERGNSPGIALGGQLVPISVAGVSIMSVVAVVATMAGFGDFFIDGWRELVNLGLPLLALAYFGQREELEHWVEQVVWWGIALFATLLVMWMVEPSSNQLDNQVNSMRILYTITAYAACWGVLYHFSSQVSKGLAATGIRAAAERLAANRLRMAYYMAIVTTAVSVASVLSTVFIDKELMLHRYLVSLLPAGLLIGLQCLKETPLANDRRQLGLTVCLLGALGLMWADLGPSHLPIIWLSRIIRVFIGASVLSALLAYFSKRINDALPGWVGTLKKLQMGGVCLAGGTLGLTLLFEVASRKLATGMSHLEVAAICIGLFSLGTALLILAIKPERDPLALSDTGRQVYVYLSELIILILAAHLWRTRPEWFGIFQESWPYILFGIAFLGAFASEYLRRSGNKVLSEPIHNTSFLLPAVPILGLVLYQDEMAATASRYQVFFFIAATINVLMAFNRRSFLHAMVAALAGNASLWAVFVGLEDFAFVDHPQFWLIPPAVSVLVAGQLNRERLDSKQMSFLRYVTISVIYLASSTEMILRWAGGYEGVFELMILAGLSMLGVAVGMLYRIRQFVYLGLVFFLVSMLGIVVKVTSYNYLWFWVSLVGFGALMLVAFAAREKYLPALKTKVEEMEGWDGSLGSQQERHASDSSTGED